MKKVFKEIVFWIMFMLLYTLSANMLTVADDLIVFIGFLILVIIFTFGISRIVYYITKLKK